MKKFLVLCLLLFVFGFLLGAGVSFLDSDHATTVYETETMAIALAATIDAHNHDRVPTENDFSAMENKMFPPNFDHRYGAEAIIDYGIGATKFGFVFGRNSQQIVVCFTVPVTLGDFPNLTSC